MKISKLFHWLYAVIMLLPLLEIGVRCGYIMFNKNAYKSYSGTNKDFYTTLTNINQVELNKTYHFSSIPDYGSQSNISSGRVQYTNPENIGITDTNYSNAILNGDYFIYYTRTNFKQLYVYDSQNNLIASPSLTDMSLQFDFTLVAYVENSFQNTLKSFSIYNQNAFSFIDNVFYYSIDKVQQSPLFNWAENSFLVTPFAYIVSLFSMPANSPIVMFLSYWLAISIIWLVFDLIMYVPLLVHRWLDKGVLE